MKKFFVGVLAIAGLVACTQEEVLRTQAPGQIAFESAYVDNAVRALEGEAAVDGTTTTNNLQSFDVWGFMNSTDGVVFDREAVKKNGEGAWAYANVQYWLPSKTYRFFAVSPAESANIKEVVKADYDNGITVEFTNVDGTEDFLYANAEDITTDSAIDAQPAPVKFGFEHLLSKVKFTFVNGIENKNAYIKVTDIQMTVPNKGTVALDQELKHRYVWENLDGTTTLKFGNLNTADGRVAGYNWAQSQVERLTIPAAESQEYTVTFNVALYMGDELASEDSKSIKVSHILFEPGKAYNLKATLDASNVAENALFPITFEAEVDGWVESTPEENDITNTVWTAEELKARLTADKTTINVVLGCNLAYDVAAWQKLAMGGANTQNINIDLNGFTLTFNQTDSDWNNITTNGAKLTIKNGNITNSGYNNGPWNRHDLNFACPVELIDVVSDKAIALKNEGTLKNVTISDANDSDTYAIWVQPKGQTVTLEKCVIDMLAASNGRGIKIDNQYLAAADDKKVTLNVTDVVFKTEQKSAILVKSAAGAEINLSNVDIANVAADSTFHVWVDEDAAAYADLVVVNGGLCKVEGQRVDIAHNADELVSLLNDSEVARIALAEGTYGTIVMKSNKTIIGTPNAKVDCVNLNGAANVTLKDIVFDAATAVMNVDGAGKSRQYGNIITGSAEVNNVNKGASNLTIDGCTFNGTFANGGAAISFADRSRKSGQSRDITIKNCTFNTVGAYYDVYGYYFGGGVLNVVNNTFKSKTQGKTLYLGNYQSSVPVVVKGNGFAAATLEDAVYLQDHSNYGVSLDASDNKFGIQ